MAWPHVQNGQEHAGHDRVAGHHDQHRQRPDEPVPLVKPPGFADTLNWIKGQVWYPPAMMNVSLGRLAVRTSYQLREPETRDRCHACERDGPYRSISRIRRRNIATRGAGRSLGRLRFFAGPADGCGGLPVLGSTTLYSWSTLRFSSVCTMPDGQRITTFLTSVAGPIPTSDAGIVGRLHAVAPLALAVDRPLAGRDLELGADARRGCSWSPGATNRIQWLLDLVSLRSRAGAASLWLTTISMSPSLSMSPKAAPAADVLGVEVRAGVPGRQPEPLALYVAEQERDLLVVDRLAEQRGGCCRRAR